MSLPDIKVEDVNQLKVVELRKYLVQYGGVTKGVKRQLKERLVEIIKKRDLERAAQPIVAIDLTDSSPTPEPVAPASNVNGKKRAREGPEFNFSKMRVKELKEFITARGAKMPSGAVEKKDLIAKCESLKDQPTIRKRPKVGDRVKLSELWIDGGPMKWCDIGRLTKDVGSRLAGTLNQPFEVQAPNGKRYWYCEKEIEKLDAGDLKSMSSEDKDKANSAMTEAKQEAADEKVDVKDLLSCVDDSCSAKDIAEVTQKIFKLIDETLAARELAAAFKAKQNAKKNGAQEKEEGVVPKPEKKKKKKRKFAELDKVSLGGQPQLKRPKHAKQRAKVPSLPERAKLLSSQSFKDAGHATGTKVEATRFHGPNSKASANREQGTIVVRNVDGSYQIRWEDGKQTYFVQEHLITVIDAPKNDADDDKMPDDPEALFKILLQYSPDAKKETYQADGEYQMDDLTNDVQESRNIAKGMKFQVGENVIAKRKPKFPGTPIRKFPGTIKGINIANCTYKVYWPKFKNETAGVREEDMQPVTAPKENLTEYSVNVVRGVAGAEARSCKVKLSSGNDNGYALLSKVLLQLNIPPNRNFERYWLRKPGSNTLIDVASRLKLAKLNPCDPVELGHFDASDEVDEKKANVELVVDIDDRNGATDSVPDEVPIRKSLVKKLARELKSQLEKLGGDPEGCVLKNDYIKLLIPLVHRTEKDAKMRDDKLANALYQDTQEVLIRPAAVGHQDAEDPSWLPGVVSKVDILDGYRVYKVYCNLTEQDELVAEEELKVPVSKSRTFNGFTFYSYQSAKLKTTIRLRDQTAGIEIEHRQDGIMVSNIHPHPGQPNIKIGDRIIRIREHRSNNFVGIGGHPPNIQVEIFREAMGYGGPRRIRRGTKNIDCCVVRSKVMWGVNPVPSLQVTHPIGNLSRHNSRSLLLPQAVPKHLCQEWLQECFRTFPKSLWQRPRSQASGWALQRGTAWLIDAKRKSIEPYKYGGANAIAIECTDMNEWDLILRIREHVCALAGISGCPPTACNVNFYEQFDASRGFVETTGWHSDDSYSNPSILSFNLGAAGCFSIRPKMNTATSENWGGKRERHIKLSSGDVITMEGEFQQHFQHKGSIHKEVPAGGVRVNFTFRWI